MALGIALLSVMSTCASLVLFWSVGWPVDAVTEWLSASSEDWERPEATVHSEDLLPVPLRSDVVETHVWSTFHFEVLNSGLVR